MGYLRRPDYYKNFRCISSACTDSCCTDWEIDIDEDTYRFYEQVGGAFGKRLKKQTCPADPETGEPAHFIQTHDERCPFLNADGLCDIFINLGEEHLSYICTHHPRYYEWFEEGREAGLGLCCEEATRLILKSKGRIQFEELEEAEEESNSCEEASGEAELSPYKDLSSEAEYVPREAESNSSKESSEPDFCDESFEPDFWEEELEIEKYLFHLRDKLFDMIADPAYEKLGSLLDALADMAAYMQDEFDDMVFPEVDSGDGAYSEADFGDSEYTEADFDASLSPESVFEEEEISHDFYDTHKAVLPLDLALGVNEFPSERTSLSFSHWFYSPKNLEKFCTFLQSLEINDMSWWGILQRMKGKAAEILEKRRVFEVFYADQMEEYKQLLNYFIYRHFMKSRDGDLLGRLGFAVLSVAMIECLSVLHWMEHGHLANKEQVDICKLYSKEIEYDEDNTVAVADYFCLR